MEANTLQSVRLSNYNIDERLHAEGIFLALLGGSMNAIGLVSIGIGERYVVVADINLREPHIHYELKSLTPVGLLGVTYHNASRIISISSKFKANQAFQLCSISKVAAVWDDFTTAIDCLRSKQGGGIWCSASLTPSSSSGPFISGPHLNYRSLPRQIYPTPDASYSSTSLSDMESQPMDGKHVVCQHVKRGHRLDCVNVPFDNFVNGNDSNLNVIAQQVAWAAKATPFGETDGLTTNDRQTDATSKPQTLAKRFLRFFSCCRTKN